MENTQNMEIGKILEKWAIRVVQNMKRVLSDNRKVNTGRLYNSITYEIDVQDKSFSIDYISYGKYVDSGRRKGATQPPISVIESWLMTNHGRSFMSKFNSGKKTKSPIKSVAFVVARSIKNKGIRPVRFLNQESKIKNVVNVMGSFKTDLAKVLGNEVKNNITKV